MTRTTRLTALAGTALVGIALTLSACGSLLGGGDDSAAVGTENAEETGSGLDGVYYTTGYQDEAVGQLTIDGDQLTYRDFSCASGAPAVKDEIEIAGVFAEDQQTIVWEQEGSVYQRTSLEGVQNYEVVSTGDYRIITLEGGVSFSDNLTEEQALDSYASGHC